MSNRRTDIDVQKDYIIQQLKSGVPRAEICRQLKCKHETLKARLVEWGVDHLKNQASKGIPIPQLRVPASEYLSKNGKRITSHRLRQILIRDKIKEEKCEECGINEWFGKPAPLELHHVNGDRFDNRLENLQILCANCHAVTGSNSGSNVGRYTRKKKKKAPPKTCVDCKVAVDRKATRCKSCAQIALGRTKIDWPDTDTLIQMVESSSYLAVARELGVSDNAVRKRIKNHS